jgi:hypothetical protein
MLNMETLQVGDVIEDIPLIPSLPMDNTLVTCTYISPRRVKAVFSITYKNIPVLDNVVFRYTKEGWAWL